MRGLAGGGPPGPGDRRCAGPVAWAAPVRFPFPLRGRRVGNARPAAAHRAGRPAAGGADRPPRRGRGFPPHRTACAVSTWIFQAARVSICGRSPRPRSTGCWTARRCAALDPGQAIQRVQPHRAFASLLTMCYVECMSVNVSVRLDDSLAERLRLRARAAGESLSDRLRRYAEEGSRRDEHPLITFRDGPAGRRAALVGGPDVWEIVILLEDLAEEDDPARVLAAEHGISRPLIDAALRYREAYPDEVEARIALHHHDTAAADTQ